MAKALPDLEEIFSTAREKGSGERTAYLNEVCGHDPALRQRVEQFLDAQAKIGSFLESPATARTCAADAPPCAEGPGTVIGPYKLLEQIGEGGFGLVFMAEQQNPVKRKVAIKVLKPGMDSRQVIARFEAERQALALMDHPNIAKVLEAGATASGRPYFAMELVRGIPITDYCDRNGLAPRERLTLFLAICQAVQHAHHKAIIHRDLKPSNVLVTLHDGAPVVKVIDFGIAKALGQQLTDKTLHTGFAQMIGTPLYMSPEQAEMSGLDIDTRSDIYSLGVLLYELLTGTTPFDKERLGKAGYDEMRRILREEEPAKPSTRLSTMGQEATVVSARRHSDAKRLSQLFRGELDWIVMKALEKERGRRYETASAFAADIQRYLHDEAVSACPPSAWYRFGKMARRNKGIWVTATLVTLALVVGTAVSVWQAILATQAADSERQALLELDKEQQATQRELGRTQEAQKKATLELFESLVAQARANRLSRRIGQRFQTLELLRKPTAMARQLNLPPERFLEMRNEAIAALALADTRVDRKWTDASDSWMNFDPTLERYARADANGDICIRHATDGVEICRLPGHGPGDIRVDYSPDGRYLAVHFADQHRSEIWHLDGEKPVRVFFETKAKKRDALRQHGPSGVCFSADSNQVAVQLADGSIEVFDLTRKKCVRRVPPVPMAYQLAFDSKGRELALACQGSAQVCDLKSGKIVWQQPVNAGWPFLKWHPAERTLGVADDDFIYLWDMSTRKQIGKMDSHAGTNFTFNRAGSLLACGGWDGKTHLWDPLTSRRLFSIWAYADGLRFSPDGDFLAVTQRHHEGLRIWEIAAGQEYRTLVASSLQAQRPYRSVVISLDGRFLVAGAAGAGGVGLWNLSTGKELAFLNASPGINCALLEPHARGAPEEDWTIVSMGVNGLFRQPIRVEPGSGAVHIGPDQRLPAPGAVDGQIAQSLDGRVLASAQGQGAVVLRADWPGQVIKVGPHEDVRYVAVSPDGRWIATGRFSSPGGAKIWKAEPPGEPTSQGLTYTYVMDLPDTALCRVVFSPDGKRLLTSGYAPATATPIVRRWELEMETWVERPFAARVEGLSPAYSPDGKLFVVETGSGIARLLDAETGNEFARLEDPDQHRTNQFAFTPDATKLACATGDGFCIHVWDLQAIRRRLAEMDLDWK